MSRNIHCKQTSCFCRCSNEKFKSQVHRVVNHGKDRHSVAFFVNADYDALLECLPVRFQGLLSGFAGPLLAGADRRCLLQSCCRDTPAKYPPIKSCDHMTEKFNSVHSSS